MANPKHLKILKQGVEVWNTWRKEQEAEPIDLIGVDLCGMNLNDADFSDADLSDVNFSDASLSGANLKRADLKRANLKRASLCNTDFFAASLSDANFSDADLTSANFIGADLYDADFSNTDLSGARLSNLGGADFHGADLSSADLTYADLSGSNLKKAKLRGAKLDYADLSNTNLSGADLIGAYLTATKVYDANLSGVTLNGAQLLNAIFANVDLSEVNGLEAVIHRGPSTIGLDTLYKSQGKIPDSFLRNAGIPEDVMEHFLPLIRNGPPIQWHSCFISYSTKNEEFARRLHSRMRAANMRVWFAPENLKGGKKLHEQLFEAIQIHDRLLIVLSKHSIQSEWVMTEIRKARETEKKEKRRKLFPIRLCDFETLRDWTCFDADTGKDLAVEVREYFIPDFSKWKDHDAFESAFARLKKDLETEKLNK